MKPLVYVIILNYNGEKWLKDCLASAQSTKYPNFRILLIDNASTDDSLELACAHLPPVEIIANLTNLGFSEGNNVGIREAWKNDADYVVLLNPDTRVEPDWLSHLIEVGENNPEIGILGSVQLKYENDDFNTWTETALAEHLEALADYKNAPGWIPVEWVEGACFAIKRKALKEVGLLDSIYFAFYEEIDFCRRASCRGFTTVVVPRSRIHHFRGGSWQANAAINRERDYRCNRSQFIFNLTDPRKSFLGNLRLYLITLATKVKELISDFSFSRAWDLARVQIDLFGSAGKLLTKWRRERSLIT